MFVKFNHSLLILSLSKDALEWSPDAGQKQLKNRPP